jgi:DNA repair protein RecO (recombination protein O)
MSASLSLIPAFVLHSRPYRDTSLLLEVFGCEPGRVGLVARGARAARSRQRGLLQPFQPLLLSWTARGELGTLTAVESAGAPLPLRGYGLYGAFYVNELLVRLLHRNDPHPELYPVYGDALAGLSRQPDPEPVLRRFEQRLLEALGYGLQLGQDAGGAELDPQILYDYQLEHGPVPLGSDDTARGVKLSGRSLLAMQEECFDDEQVRRDARRLTRAALDLHLGSTPLKTRAVLRQLVKVR